MWTYYHNTPTVYTHILGKTSLCLQYFLTMKNCCLTVILIINIKTPMQWLYENRDAIILNWWKGNVYNLLPNILIHHIFKYTCISIHSKEADTSPDVVLFVEVEARTAHQHGHDGILQTDMTVGAVCHRLDNINSNFAILSILGW